MPTPDSFEFLLRATGDDFRLVRVHAAMALARFAGLFMEKVKTEDRQNLEKANQEYLESLTSRPDQWSSQYNLGNYHMNRGDYRLALVAYETAARFDPRNVLPLVNASIAHARLGQQAKAARSLERALEVAPESAAAHYNLGLMKAEQQDLPAAEGHLRAALKADPDMAEAAYNLGILLARKRPEDALGFLNKAYELRKIPKYGYTLAFYLKEREDTGRATAVLQQIVNQHPTYMDACLLLGDIYEKDGRTRDAEKLYRETLRLQGLAREYRNYLEARLSALPSAGNQNQDSLNEKK
jgi:tetratricopeptide (TPR) repeat protein